MWPEALRAGSDIVGGAREALSDPQRDPRAIVCLERLLGTGAVTEVWSARSASGRVLAVKRFVAETETPDRAHRLLEREALLLSKFAHPSIVGTYGVIPPGRIAELDGRLGGQPGLALERLLGGDLVGLAGLPPNRWIAVLERVVEAVGHLHEGGYVHGDIKARNVLLDATDQAKLIDFSTCLPIGAVCSSPLGTPSQQRLRRGAHTVTVDDDLFASAALVFELITGGVPFIDEAARASLSPAALAHDGDAESGGPLASLGACVRGMLSSARPLENAALRELKRRLADVARALTIP